MKTNKKLALNKKIVASLDAQSMGAVKGGGTWIELLKIIIVETIHMTVYECFSGDPKGICETDLCTVSCQSCPCTEYVSCYGGSCGKCG